MTRLLDALCLRGRRLPFDDGLLPGLKVYALRLALVAAVGAFVVLTGLLVLTIAT